MMPNPYDDLALEAVIWLASLIGCAIALFLSRREPPKWPALALTLAVGALAIGAEGLWATFGVMPRVQLELDVQQFFVVPLVLGSLLLLLLLSRVQGLRRSVD
jgi:hypothetical protein